MTTYQALVSTVDALIRNEANYDDDGYSLSYDSLDDADQQKIVALFIDNDDRDLFSLTENEKYDDIVSSLLKMLKNDNQESEQDFTACLKGNLRNYYAKRAQVLIDERCSEIDSLELARRGYHRTIDQNHGDSVIQRIGG